MRHVCCLMAGALFAVGLATGHASADELKPGDAAPNFTLPATDGRTYSLDQLKGQWVVLAWFPKAFTAG